MSNLRFGIIGAGGIAATLHLPELVALEGAEVAVVAGRNPRRLQRLCSHFGVPKSTQEYSDIIEDTSIDAVVVSTPHPLHVQWGIRALEAGKHVLMQKPLCGDMDEANAFVAAAERAQRVVLCMPHYPPYIYALRQRCQEGEIGRISGAYCRTSHGGPEVYYAGIRQFFAEEEEEELWFFDPQKASVGALFDMGVYAVASLVAVLGPMAKVTGIATTFAKPTPLEDVATLLLQSRAGALVTAETSWCDPARSRSLTVHGTAGKFTWPGGDGGSITQWTPTSYTDERAPVQQSEVVCGPGSGNVHQHFVDCVRRGQMPPLSNPWAARHVSEILLAGMESARTGQTIQLKTGDTPSA